MTQRLDCVKHPSCASLFEGPRKHRVAWSCPAGCDDYRPAVLVRPLARRVAGFCRPRPAPGAVLSALAERRLPDGSPWLAVARKVAIELDVPLREACARRRTRVLAAVRQAIWRALHKADPSLSARALAAPWGIDHTSVAAALGGP